MDVSKSCSRKWIGAHLVVLFNTGLEFLIHKSSKETLLHMCLAYYARGE